MAEIENRPRQSSVLALVPELEPVVGVHRRRLDPSDPGGVGPHVTVLHPFVAPDTLDEATVTRLRGIVAGHAAFDCAFREVVFFDDGLLTLAPEPAAPFRALTEAVWAAFPDHPPYAGRFEPVPHLTVAYADAPRVERERAAGQIEPLLPVDCRIDRLTLLVDDPDTGRWCSMTELELGSDRRSARPRPGPRPR